MGRFDNLLKPFRKDRASSPSPHPPHVPPAAPNSAPAPAPAPAPVQSALVAQRPVRVRETEVNSALRLAIQKHFDDLPEADKDAFREASKQIDEDNLLSKVKTYDDAHMKSSSLRSRTRDISKFLGLLNRCMAGICTAIQANPDPSSIIVGAVQIAISLAIEFVSFFDRLTDMLNCFNDYLGLLAEYAKASDVDLILQTVASVYGDLLKFCSAVRHVFVDNKGDRRKWMSIRTFLRVQWEPFEGVFGDIETNFKHHLNVLGHSAGALQFNALRAGMHEAEEERLRLAKKENMKEREAFLRWISDLDFDKTHEDIYSTKHPGTGNWLVETDEFKTWLDSPKSTLLWCHGTPGVGKSVLMSNVLEHITTKYGLRKDTGISFAYYNYQMPDLGDPSRVVSSFIKQLCRKKDTVSSDLLKFKHESTHPTYGRTQDAFFSLATSFSEVFLIIDALDECPRGKRHNIIGFLLKVVEIIPRARVFVTSRRESDIADVFERGETPIIKIEARSVTADIRLYIQAEVKRLRVGYNGKRLYLKNDVLEEKIIRTLTDKAEGMFLWVNLQLENLRYVSEARKDRLIESALEDIPKGLDDTYKRILRQIDAQQPYLKSLALKSFEWVLYAKRPLRTSELREALAPERPPRSRQRPEIDEVDVVLKACANLLVEENDIIRPIHYSVQEFLMKYPSSAFQGSCLENIQASAYVHQKLALTCISYLQLDILHQGPCRTVAALDTRFIDNPFLWYAARFFDYHAAALQDLPNDLLQPLEGLLHLDGMFLAALIQVRKIQNRHIFSQLWAEFDRVAYPVDINTILYSSPLYDKPQLNAKLDNDQVPIYALHDAAANGYLPAITRLIELGCSINERGRRGVTPLYLSALNGHEAAAKVLLEHGAEVNAKGGDYDSALQAASAGGHEAIVKLLLKQGPEVNGQGGEYGSALQAASHQGHQKIVKLLLEHGADVNTRGGDYDSALQAASAGGHEAIVKLLLKQGASVNAQGEYSSALQAVSGYGDEAIVKLLLKHGANVNAPGPSGGALQAASQRGHEALVKLLLEQGAEVNAQGGAYGGALQAASHKGHQAIVKLLLEQGADINAQGGDRGSALQFASTGGHEAIVKLLLERGAKVNAQGGFYGSALKAASQQGHEEVVKLLLEHGANVNTRGGDHGSALQLASGRGFEGIVKLLLEHGAEQLPPFVHDDSTSFF